MNAHRRILIGLSMMVMVVSMAGLIRAQSGEKHAVSAEQYQRWKTELSNWGRWGKEDQIGALNLITPAKRRQAASLVKEGISVSLAADADTVKAVDNPTPYEVTMQGIASDRIAINYHGISHTHLDSLAHINEQGVFYNGYKPDAETVVKERHSKNSIHNVKNGVFTRGVLIDIPRLKGVPYLEPGTPIYVEDLEAWEKQSGVKVSAGDALFVRTGVWAPTESGGSVAEGQGRRWAIGGTSSLGDPLAQGSRHRPAWQRSPSIRIARVTRAHHAARCTTSRSSISASTCSITAISRRWPRQRHRASAGSSC